MKRVLILSCSTGQGHDSCAQAVKSYCKMNHIDCDIRDSFEFISKRISRFISWGHSFMYRHLPGLFRWGYRQGEQHPALLKQGSLIHKALTSRADRMYDYIIQGNYDTVICSHIFAAMMLTQMLKKHSLPIRTAFIATDYTYYPGMGACNLQKYFIADESFTDELINGGVKRDNIIAAGIPVRRAFYNHTEKADAKRLLDTRSNSKHLLVMCGSMGCGPIARMLKLISKEMTENMEVSVICGTNDRLFRKLSRKYKKRSDIHIVGYTNQIPLYMDSADLYLTKPGGVSVTEAAVKCLPMAFINAVAGCEQYNMDFFRKNGAAITADSIKELVRKTIALLNSTAELRRMENALREHKISDGAACVFRSLSEGAPA